MSSLNKVSLIGRLGKDPEVKSFQNGGKVCNFSLATSERWKDKSSGEMKERTEWHNIAIMSDGLVGVAERYLRKGSQCYVEGQLRTRKWQDKSGNDRYTTEIVLSSFDAKLVLLGEKGEGGGQTSQSRGANREDRKNPADEAPWEDELDDDIPF